MTRRATIVPGLLAAAFALHPGDASTQARGPSHSQTRDQGMHIAGRTERRELMLEEAMELAEAERIALLDPAERARRLAVLEDILRRLPGRFRIEGQIERPGQLGVQYKGKVTGLADCSAVGDSVGLNCIINASWPVIDPILPGPIDRISAEPPSQQLNAMRPAVLVVGLNMDPPGLRGMIVTADTLASTWVGTLGQDGVNLARSSRCWADVRCYRTFEVRSPPEDDVMSFVFKAGAYTINFNLHPDPEASATRPMKPLKQAR